MNKFIKFLVSTILIVSFNAYAQKKVYETQVVCDNPKDMIKVLLENGEQPIVIAESDIDSRLTVTVWLNTSGEMTVTQSSNQLMCMLAAGTNSKYKMLQPSKSLSNY